MFHLWWKENFLNNQKSQNIMNMILFHMDYYHSLMLLSRKLLCKYTK